MNRDIFVENVKRYCATRGIKPTVACREAGVGTSFIADINRGQTPSVSKVQDLAAYLGVTVSDLIGDAIPHTWARELTEQEQDLLEGYRRAEPNVRAAIDALLLPVKKKEQGAV